MTMLRFERTQWPAAMAALCACLLVGATVAVRAPAAPLLVAAGALALLSLEWRRGVLALLVVLPFSGVPVFVAGQPGLALRDVAIVLPIYASFALWITYRRESVLPPMGVALPALALFAVMVLAHVALAPSLVVGAIGTKVWLAYIPMLAVGYHFVRTGADFERAMRWTAWLGLIPACIALAEWTFASRQPQVGVWTNDFGPFRYLYGSWYAAVQPNGLALPIGDHTFVVPRVPSTFTSSTQFYVFAIVAYAAGLSQALRSGQWRWYACAVVLAIGVIASGERQAYVVVPAIATASIVLADRAPAMLVLASVCSGLIGVIALEGAPTSVLGAIPAHAQASLATAWGELRSAAGTGLIGHGTGWDTQSALRYGGSASTRYIENWYAKAALETGLAGLAAIVLVLASLHWRLFAALARVDLASRRAAAPVCVALVAMTLTLFKGPVLDLDPLNVYFWLLIGMLLSYLRLGRDGGSASREAAA